MSDSPDEQFEDPQERLAALQAQLASTPASAILANHCYGLFELAAVHLSISPPNFAEARVAIDGLAGLINARCPCSDAVDLRHPFGRGCQSHRGLSFAFGAQLPSE
ncbi:MAG: hypothetical protein NT160_01925 [Actinobacteria bacterium]|nr:hypothetical protein [Actinomycetota bacterium]